MRRATFILIWAVAFAALAYLLFAVPFAIFLLHRSSDPPTELLFLATMTLCPLAGLSGIVLGLLGKLPGTKRRK